jgi:osmotically-inducible protein OsmY
MLAETKNLKGAIPVALAVSSLLLGGCVVALGSGHGKPKTSTRGQYIKKQNRLSHKKRALIARVLHAINNDPLLNGTDLDARVTGHMVTLTGKLYDFATLEHAIKVVKGVKGVQSVVSRVEITVDNQANDKQSD